MPNLVNDFEVRKETLRALGGNPDGLANIYEVDLEILKLIGSGGGGIDWDTIKQKLAEDGVESIKFTMAGEDVILTAEEVKNLLNQTVLPDAPSDGQQYARQDGAWTPVESVEPGIPDAPSDGKTYGRNNGAWTTVEEGITDAPLDGQQYARQNGEWTPVQIPTVEKYLTITADESNTGETIIHPNIEGSLPNLNLQYRINNGKWTDFIVGTTADIKIGAGDVLQFKGDNKDGISTNSGNNTLNFGISGNPVALSGNIMSLIDGVGDALEIPCNYCFCRLFRNSAIKTVSSDFLPATTLKDSCYRDLFSGCQNLTQAPDLPATTLATDCYNGMFYNCALLTTAPELPAKVLLDGCYGYMFTYCYLLNYVKCLATEGTINGDGTVPSALNNWLEGVASTGTFEKLSGVSYEAGGHHGIPEGWTVKEIYEYVEAPMDGNQYARQNGTWTVVEPGISDAPSDGKTYGRNNGAWTLVKEGLTDSPSDGKQYARQDGNWAVVEKGISDSPSDGKQYARQDGVWTVVTEGITDSPSDGKQYARQDGNWAVVEKGILDAPIDGVQYARQNGGWTPVEMGLDWNTIKQKLAVEGVESIKFIMAGEEIILTASELKTLLNQPVIPEGKYMTITADKSNSGETIISPTVTGTLSPNLQYRINNGSWTDFVVGTTADIHVVAGDFVQFKGNNTSGISTSTSNYLNFSISGLFHLSGNVMSLIDGVGETLIIPNDYCFYRLFFNSIVQSVSTDFLPSISFINGCYEKMFRECQNLTNAPELPSTTLSSSCYNELFIGCPNLKQAPELPATTLEYNCYHGMFQGCSNLVKAPELPATTLAENCYESMFSGCINLTQAPVLPAKTLVDSCYYFMFDNCRKLNGVKSLAVEGLNNSSALGSWLNSVASSGTFEKPYGVVYPTGSIPTGWTVKDVDLYIEAPIDGKQYARQDGAWTVVTEGLTDSPSDGKQYARQDGAWVEVEPSKVKTTKDTTLKFWDGTQQEYDAITTKDANTLYIIS